MKKPPHEIIKTLFKRDDNRFFPQKFWELRPENGWGESSLKQFFRWVFNSDRTKHSQDFFDVLVCLPEYQALPEAQKSQMCGDEQFRECVILWGNFEMALHCLKTPGASELLSQTTLVAAMCHAARKGHLPFLTFLRDNHPSLPFDHALKISSGALKFEVMLFLLDHDTKHVFLDERHAKEAQLQLQMQFNNFENRFAKKLVGLCEQADHSDVKAFLGKDLFPYADQVFPLFSDNKKALFCDGFLDTFGPQSMPTVMRVWNDQRMLSDITDQLYQTKTVSQPKKM